MTESTVWRVMHPDGSRTVVGHYPLALASAMQLMASMLGTRLDRAQWLCVGRVG